MYKYYNANPLSRHVNDCTVRAISLATGQSWDETYQKISRFARARGIMPDDVMCIDEYLEVHFTKVCGCKGSKKISVYEFLRQYPIGVFLITMNGHITCAIDGIIYDTFDPSDRIVWGAYKV